MRIPRMMSLTPEAMREGLSKRYHAFDKSMLFPACVAERYACNLMTIKECTPPVDNMHSLLRKCAIAQNNVILNYSATLRAPDKREMDIQIKKARQYFT